MPENQSIEPETVSVIVPVYNGKRFLAEALQSIVQQTRPVHEILVVDDGSTDDSSRIAATIPGVCVLRISHQGLGVALNHGIRHATGHLLAFLDADDRWLPNKQERQIAALRERTELDIAFGHVRQFSTRPTENGTEEIWSTPQPAISKPSMLIRRASFDRVGWFSEGEKHHDFLDWYARAIEQKLQSLMLQDVVFERRIHDHNMGRADTSKVHQRFFSTLRATIHRRHSSCPFGDRP